VYENVDSQTGANLLKALKPEELDLNEYLMYHIRVRFSGVDEDDIDALFIEDEHIHNFDLLDAVKEEIDIWIPEETILQSLNEKMSREDVEKLCTLVDEI